MFQGSRERETWHLTEALEMCTQLGLVELRERGPADAIPWFQRALTLRPSVRTMSLAITVEGLAAAASMAGEGSVALDLAATASVLRERTGVRLSVLGSRQMCNEVEGKVDPAEREHLRAEVRDRDPDMIVGSLIEIAEALTH